MLFADVAELADALDLGSSVTDVGVQVPSSAPYRVFLQNFKVFVCHSVFFIIFFSMKMLRCQAIQLLCEFIASKNRSSIKAFHLYSERSFFSLFMRGISIFYFKFSTIRINTEAACALVVFAFGAKLPSVLPVITDFSAAHITASFA